ncbi:hypothetical protein NQZ68_027274 [Dissostichus eleginoides]|nr:hypothetical protein NQZ68_027274 [Dissostichus eleginoides]
MLPYQIPCMSTNIWSNPARPISEGETGFLEPPGPSFSESIEAFTSFSEAPRVEQEIICRDSESLNEDTDVVELSRSQTDAL